MTIAITASAVQPHPNKMQMTAANLRVANFPLIIASTVETKSNTKTAITNDADIIML